MLSSLLPLRCLQSLVEPTKEGVQVGLALIEMERLLHLSGGFPACPGTGHRQRRRDAVRRKRQIALG